MVCKFFERLNKLYELNFNLVWINSDLYRLVCSLDMLVIVYECIKFKFGNMILGIDGEIFDGFLWLIIE